MIRYLLLLPLFILMRLSTFILAPFAVAYQRDFHLRFPFRWMDTIDNDLRGDGSPGDGGWQGEHCPPDDPASYCCMVKWMFRNGGNWASYYTFGVPYGSTAWWSVGARPFLGRELQWRLGWNTQDQKQMRSKYNLAIRWRLQKPAT